MGLAGIDLVLNTVEAGHKQGGQAQVAVRGGIRAAEFQPLGLRFSLYMGMRTEPSGYAPSRPGLTGAS